MPTKKTRRARSSKTSPVASNNSSSYQPPVFSNAVSYLLIVLLMVSSFTAGYLFLKLRSLQTNNVANNQVVPQQPTTPTEMKIAKPSTNEHWKGNKDARYVWVEYSDFECPFCKTIHPNIVQLMDQNKDKVAWVYRHYPLPFHQNAQKEAEASECITELGGNDAFWQYADKVFERTTSNGTGFELTALAPLAGELGLDQSAFQQCLDSNKYEQKVKDESAEGQKAGVNATPTSVIYDMKTGKTKVIEGAVPFDSLKQELDSFLSANK